MKKLSIISLACLLAMAIFTLNAQAQDAKPYTEGSVWEIQYIQTKPGMGREYLKNLSAGWVKLMKEAKSEGLILDYKVLSAEPASKTDWDLMLLIELKNYAALDGLEDKMDVMAEKMFGSEDTQQKEAVARNDLRDLLGGRLAQELIFK